MWRRGGRKINRAAGRIVWSSQKRPERRRASGIGIPSEKLHRRTRRKSRRNTTVNTVV